MYWNYRICKTVRGYGIHEMYYDDNGEVSWTEDPVPVVGGTEEEVVAEFKHMTEALGQPVFDTLEAQKEPKVIEEE